MMIQSTQDEISLTPTTIKYESQGILLGLLFGVAGSLVFSSTSTSIMIETPNSLKFK